MVNSCVLSEPTHDMVNTTLSVNHPIYEHTITLLNGCNMSLSPLYMVTQKHLSDSQIMVPKIILRPITHMTLFNRVVVIITLENC